MVFNFKNLMVWHKSQTPNSTDLFPTEPCPVLPHPNISFCVLITCPAASSFRSRAQRILSVNISHLGGVWSAWIHMKYLPLNAGSSQGHHKDTSLRHPGACLLPATIHSRYYTPLFPRIGLIECAKGQISWPAAHLIQFFRSWQNSLFKSPFCPY